MFQWIERSKKLEELTWVFAHLVSASSLYILMDVIATDLLSADWLGAMRNTVKEVKAIVPKPGLNANATGRHVIVDGKQCSFLTALDGSEDTELNERLASENVYAALVLKHFSFLFNRMFSLVSDSELWTRQQGYARGYPATTLQILYNTPHRFWRVRKWQTVVYLAQQWGKTGC